MERNNELRTAWDFVESTGRSIFLTGKAGQARREKQMSMLDAFPDKAQQRQKRKRKPKTSKNKCRMSSRTATSTAVT